ncbi:MAG: pyridoxal phosphate-dependent aminotransferase [Bacteroidota bacterium]|nr:pyridoxal phosphate-dependent aminotransferase [Bacteroidota bacterium]MDX5431173.1 pyridoxal phosphate-dependent aminotransferase [Bacteroidota bacterium]MDX5469912.1 pyridoxal phosphate-dependent aminotransferase [Bacteroidota bacterium]
MNYLADRVSWINESQTIAMAKAGRELKAKGHDVINLSFGEPDFDTPTHIRNAAKQAIDDGYTYYTPVAGYPELREAVVNKLKRDNDLDYSMNQIVISTGAKHSIMNVIMAITNPGDEIIIPTPYRVSYSEMVKLVEGVPVFVDADVESNFKITAAQLEAAITPKTKAFLFSSPCNPTGSVYSREELEALKEVFVRYPQIVIISDEIYEYINFIGQHESIAQFEELQDRTVIVNGVSKGFAMTGWRIGYIAAPLEIAQACEKLQGQFTSGASSISQRAALAALISPLTSAFQMREAFLRRRDMVLGLLQEIPGFKCNVPDGAFYVFPDVSYYFGKKHANGVIENANDLCLYILNTCFVSLVPGEAFGAPKCLRLSYAASDETLKDAIHRIKEVLSNLQA